MVAAGDLSQPFSEIAIYRMVLLSHILRSAVWMGIAEDALGRAIGYARANYSGAPPRPTRGGAWMHTPPGRRGTRSRRSRPITPETRSPGLGLRANVLKVRVSLDTVHIAQMALEICGMAGYSETGEFSVSRHLRDLYSARLMNSNDRLGAVNAELLAFGDELS